ncbi:MAG: hypothetical protein IGR76_16005 [Synechococcales cyanobacterium T60_A2020_003]|nr:hypothetical protein [Synechococcales cyanobacterium T60_A2020_003]
MRTSFLALQVPLQGSTVLLCHAIEQSLTQYGIPLRWAITTVDREAQVAHIEAIVTSDDGTLA